MTGQLDQGRCGPHAYKVRAARRRQGCRPWSSTPAYWLIKSEPEKYAYDDLVRDGRTVWDGVRNNQAALYLKAMKIGDLALYYHSNIGLEIVAVARVVEGGLPRPVRPGRPLRRGGGGAS